MGPRAGQKLFTFRAIAPRLQGLEGDANGAARAGGFSLHAGVEIAPHQCEKLERLCRYVSRPRVAIERLALVPLPRMHLTRFHGGVFAPHSKLRAAVTLAHRGIGAKQPPADASKPPTPRRDELGAALEARVRHRDRQLCPLRREAQDHRQHRGAAGHREDPLAPAAHGAGAPLEAGKVEHYRWKLPDVDNIMYVKPGDYRKATQSVWFGGATPTAVTLPVAP